MRILALDIAKVTGFAIGPAGTITRSGSVKLDRLNEGPAQMTFNLLAFLVDDLFVFGAPDLVAIEAALNPAAHKSANSVPYAFGGAYVASAISRRYGCRVEFINNDKVRKHFIGTARTGDRDKTKAAVIQRCIQLGYLPRDSRDDDRADACAIHDFASATFGRVRPSELMMFGEARP